MGKSEQTPPAAGFWPRSGGSGGYMEGLFQPTHLLLIFLIALLIFGPKKLPDIGKGIGEGFRALKDGMKDKPAETPSTPTATSTNSTGQSS
jgi:sec-independent protein translocase protein TatA